MNERKWEDTKWKRYPIGGLKCSVCGKKVTKKEAVRQPMPGKKEEYVYCPVCLDKTAPTRIRIMYVMNSGR